MTNVTTYRPVRVRPRTGEQSNGHQTYFIGVPWQIAEAIPSDQKFVPEVDLTTGVLTFTPTEEPELARLRDEKNEAQRQEHMAKAGEERLRRLVLKAAAASDPKVALDRLAREALDG